VLVVWGKCPCRVCMYRCKRVVAVPNATIYACVMASVAIQLNMERVRTTQSEPAVSSALPAWGCVHYYLEINIPVLGSVVFALLPLATLTACRPQSCLRLSNQPSVAVSCSTGAMFVVVLVVSPFLWQSNTLACLQQPRCCMAEGTGGFCLGR
jgi:hypothetical protein